MVLLGLLVCVAVNLPDRVEREDFGPGWESRWRLLTPARWTLTTEGRNRVLQMREPGTPPTTIRRPGEYAIWTAQNWADVEFTLNARCDQDESVTARDAVILFGYQDDTHFYYAHLAGRSDAVHNAILKVDGRDRERIDTFDPAHPNPVTLSDRRFHKVRIVRRVESGEIMVYFDERPEPVMKAVDRTFTWGKLGVGSFDDTASFHTLHAKGVPADVRP